MPNYELTGTVKKIMPLMTFPSGFTKREVIITSEGDRFPQEIPMGFTKDKISMLDTLKEGERIKVTFDLRGREYNGKYFINCEGWKLQKMDDGSADAPPSPPSNFEPEPGDLDDKMPF